MADSGATRSLTGDLSMLSNIRQCKIYVRCANGDVMVCEKVGDLIVSTGKNVLVLRDVLYVHGAPFLVSVSQLTNELKLKVLFSDSTLEVYRSIDDVLTGNPIFRSGKKLTDKLWYVTLRKVHQYKNRYKQHPNPLIQPRSNESSYSAWVSRINPDVDVNVLHRRYGHVSLKYLQIRFPHLRHVKKLDFCDACGAMEGRRPYSKKYSVDRDKKMKFKVAPVGNEVPDPPDPPPEEHPERVECVLNESDVLVFQYTLEPEDRGPDSTYFGRYFSSDTKYCKTESVRGYRYLFIVVDKDSRVTFGFLGAYKHEFTPIILSWLKSVKLLIGKFPAFWKFDSGTEFLNHELVYELRKEGIQLLFTTKGAHNQNPISERKIGVIWEAVLTTLADSGVPMQFWCYCAQYIITVLNHVPNRGINYQVPLAKAKLKLIDVLFFVFGCEVWWRDEDAVSNQTWSQRGVFLGISQIKQGYEILDIATGKVIQTRNVLSNELRRPFRDAMQPCRIQLDFGSWPSITEEKVSISGKPFMQKSAAEERGASQADDVPLQLSSPVPLQPPPSATSQVLVPPVQEIPEIPLGASNLSESKLVQPPVPDSPLSAEPAPDSPVPTTDPPPPDLSSQNPVTIHVPATDAETTSLPSIPVTVSTPKSGSQDSKSVPADQEKQPLEVSPIDLDLDLFSPQFEADGKDDHRDSDNFWSSYPTLNLKSELEVKNPVIKLPDNPVGKILPTIKDSSTPNPTSVVPTGKKILKPRNPLVNPVHLRLKSKPKVGKTGPPLPKNDVADAPQRMFLDLNEEIPTPRQITGDPGTTITPDPDKGYPIEKILDRRWVGRGKGTNKYDYLVQWEGDFENSWIPGANLKHAQGVLKNFNKTAPPVDIPVRSQKPRTKMSGDSNAPKKVKFNLEQAATKHSYNMRPRKDTNYAYLFQYEPKLPEILETPPKKKDKANRVYQSNKVQIHNHKELSNFAKTVHKTEKLYKKAGDLPNVAFVTTESLENYLNARAIPKVFPTTTLGTEPSATPNVVYKLDESPSPPAAEIDPTPRKNVVNIKDIPSFEEDEFFTKDYIYTDDDPKCATKIPMGKPEYKTEFYPCEDMSLEEILKSAEDSIREFLKLDSTVLDSPEEEAMVSVDNTTVPKTRSAMLKGTEHDVKNYLEAEERELLGIHKHGTFEKVYCPEGRTPITCRWVYDLKRNAKGEIILFKARLVVHGFKQQEGIDFNKTFSSTAQVRTFRVFVALAVIRGLKITQYDISNAFLNGTLEEEIYMEWPPGYPSKDKGTVVKLLKGLYGLKQASRIWQKTLQTAFAKVDMVTCKTESGVLRSTRDGKFTLALTWVDDICLLADNEDYRTEIEATLKKDFLVKCLGELELYVGIVVQRERVNGNDTITIHQKPYNERVAKEYGPNFHMKATVPAPDARLSKEDCPKSEEEKSKISYRYINATGSLLYSVMCTRPDLYFPVMQLARFNSNPGEKHVRASQQAVRYLGNTAGTGLRFTRPENPNDKVKIIAYVDSDWAGCIDTRRSTMGYIIQIAGGPVSYKSKLMPTLALSSCEAEFMALTELCRELMWMCRFLDEIGVDYEIPEIYCDSSSAIAWSQDPIQHQRNKHMELKYYYVRDCVEKDCVKLFKIHTTLNCADIMTKPVGRQILERLLPVAHGYARRDFDEKS